MRSPEASSVRTQAIVGVVVSTLLLLVCCCNVLAIPSIVTSAIAIGRADRDLSSARTLMRWSWGMLAAAVALSVLAGILYSILGARTSTLPAGTT
jgi:hypothetical protein